MKDGRPNPTVGNDKPFFYAIQNYHQNPKVAKMLLKDERVDPDMFGVDIMLELEKNDLVLEGRDIKKKGMLSFEYPDKLFR